MPHGSLVTLMEGLECPHAEENPELEPPIPWASALSSEHLRPHFVQCCTTFSHWALSKNSCGCCLLHEWSMPVGCGFAQPTWVWVWCILCGFVLTKWWQLWGCTPSEDWSMYGFSWWKQQQHPAFEGLPAWSHPSQLSCVSSLPGGEVVTIRMTDWLQITLLPYFICCFKEKPRKSRNKL